MALASVLPLRRGDWAVRFGWITNAAIALLFFLHGAKLSREAILAGIGHWRLHLPVAASTFVLFPVLGFLLIRTLGNGWIDPTNHLLDGILFLCLLPSTNPVVDRLHRHSPGQCAGGGVQRHPVQRGGHLPYPGAGRPDPGRPGQGRS